MATLNVVAHALHNWNLAFILIFAVLELWLIQQEINWVVFFLFFNVHN